MLPAMVLSKFVKLKPLSINLFKTKDVDWKIEHWRMTQIHNWTVSCHMPMMPVRSEKFINFPALPYSVYLLTKKKRHFDHC